MKQLKFLLLFAITILAIQIKAQQYITPAPTTYTPISLGDQTLKGQVTTTVTTWFKWIADTGVVHSKIKVTKQGTAYQTVWADMYVVKKDTLFLSYRDSLDADSTFNLYAGYVGENAEIYIRITNIAGTCTVCTVANPEITLSVENVMTGCDPVTPCDMIRNGGFEELINNGCGIDITDGVNCWLPYENSTDVYRRYCTPGIWFNLGSSTANTSPALNSHNGSPNNTIIGQFCLRNGNEYYSESVQSPLITPLISGRTYSLSFWVYNYSGQILSSGSSNPQYAPCWVSFASSPGIVSSPSSNPAMTSTYPIGRNVLTSIQVNPVNTWTQYSQTFTYSGPTSSNFMVGPDMGLNINWGWVNTTTNKTLYVAFDDISLIDLSNLGITANVNHINCDNNIATYTLTGTGAIANSYTWNPGGNVQTIVVSPTTTTVYTLTAQTAPGCFKTLTYTATVMPSPQATVIATSTAICQGSSTTLSVTGTGFTPSHNIWTPSPCVPSSCVNPTITVTPTVTTTYSVLLSSTNGCKTTKTITINVVPTGTPTLTITASPTVVCVGGSSTLTASGAQTYTWSPGGSNLPSIVVSPTVATIYTVQGTSACGTVGTKTISIGTTSNFTITATASPTIICAGNNSTLTATGATSYTWSNGANTSTTSVHPFFSNVYTVTGANAAGCISTKTVGVVVGPFSLLTVNPGTICAGQTTTLSASGATSYTWSTGPNTSSITVSPTVTTSYTVSGSSGSCLTSTAVLTVTVNPSPTLSITASTSTMCVGSSATFTASGATTYSWSSGDNTAITTVSPGAINIYTVTGTTNGCSSTKTVQVTLTGQYCCQSSAATIGSSPTSTVLYAGISHGGGAIVDIQGTLTFTANSTLANYILRMAPGSRLHVNPGVTLGITSCTLFSCSELWNGIEMGVDPTTFVAGNITVQRSTIEDMYNGISVNWGYNSNVTGGVINISSSKLNKNYVSVQMLAAQTYSSSSTNKYPLTITTTTISSIYSNTSPLTTLKPSTVYSYAYNNINNPAITYTNFPRTYKGINLQLLNERYVVIGDSTNKGNTNRFENMDIGIYSFYTRLKVHNNHFINLTGSTKQYATTPPTGPDEIGVGVWSDFNNAAPTLTSPLYVGTGTVVPSGQSPFPKGNKFEDCNKGVRAVEASHLVVRGNLFTTTETGVTPILAPISPQYTYYKGQCGIWSSALELDAVLKYNYINNHNVGIYSSHNILTSYISNAFIKIENNFIEATGSTGYCKFGISVEQPSSTNNLNTGMLTVKNNTIQNVYNGVKAILIKAGLQVNDNPLISLNASGLYGLTNSVLNPAAYTRTGILVQNSTDVVIANNPNITSTGTIPAGYNTVKGIWLSSTSGTTGQVNCNTISNMGRCMQFSGTSLNKVAKNVMNGTYQGFVLNTLGVIGQQGNASIVNDNEWHGFTGGSAPYAETYTESSNTANTGSILYVKSGSPYEPTQNYSNGTAYSTVLGGIRVQAPGTAGESCLSLRSMNGDPNGGMAMRTATDKDSTINIYEVLASDTAFYEMYQDESMYKNKQLVYELLNSQSIDTTQTLQDFYKDNQSGNYNNFVSVNAAIATEDYSTAQSINSSIKTNNTIEAYQKRVNELLLKYLNPGSQSFDTTIINIPARASDIFDSSELTDLKIIANSCLDKYGSVVSQARVLVNGVTNRVMEYEDNCKPEYNKRKSTTNTIPTNTNGITASVLPNPNNGNFILQYDLALYTKAELVIYDVTGKLMLKENLTNTEKQMNINVSKFDNGIYYYSIRTNKELLATSKFVIIK